MTPKPYLFHVLVLGVLMIAVGCSDRRESVFANIKEANASGAVVRGWVPGDLPESTTDLREVHDVDTNEVWGTFRFQPGEAPSFTMWRRVESIDAKGQTIRSPHSNWWPGVLTGSLDAHLLETSGLALYSRADPFPFWMAIDPTRGVGFFWATARSRQD